LLADECSATIEELSVVIRWVENGLPACGALRRKADASTINETLTDYMKKKGLVIGNMIGMGFDGAATFSGRHNGIQALLNENSLNFCALPLPSLATGLCKQYSRYQTYLHNTNCTLEILSLFIQMG